MRIKISGLNLHYCLREHRILYLLRPNTSHHVVLLMAACTELWASTASFSQTFNVLRRFFQTVMKAAPLPIMLRLQMCGHQHDVLLPCGLLGRQWWHLNTVLCGSAMRGGSCRGCQGGLWGWSCGSRRQAAAWGWRESCDISCYLIASLQPWRQGVWWSVINKTKRVWRGVGSSGKFVNVV